MSKAKLGLALGGGSARGLAHIKVLEAFDELGIKPDFMVGCSIGSLVGAAYASGISAAEISDHAQKILSNPASAARYVFMSRTGSMFDFFDVKSFTSMQMDGLKVAELALPDGVAKNIEDTMVPFATIATDFYSLTERVFDRGSLIEAVASSIAIPGLIAAPEIDNRVMIDGGLTNPVPFDHLRDKADFIIAVDVTGKPVPGKKNHPSNVELAIGGMLIAFHQMAALRRRQNPPDIYIEPSVDEFQAHDFFKLKDIMQATEPAKDEVKRVLELHIEAQEKLD